jgi:maleylacetoacetate isomerase
MTSSATNAEAFTLYSYFRSSAAFRVRIALNLKEIDADYRFVHLLKDGGQQHAADYARFNPQELVPTLLHDGRAIGQSLAIMEYLDEIKPEPPLLPKDALGRARVRQLAYIVACDTHPVNNLRVLNYLRDPLGHSGETVTAWMDHWIHLGFNALETMLSNSPETGRFCHGERPTIADICLIPQLANARRGKLDLNVYPTLLRIEDAAFELPAFEKALPKNQPDAE